MVHRCQSCLIARNNLGKKSYDETSCRNRHENIGTHAGRCWARHAVPVFTVFQKSAREAAVAILQKPYRLRGEGLSFPRKHMDLNQEELAKLLRVNKTTLSKWENNEDPIGLQSDL